jgi:hypothetical protein
VNRLKLLLFVVFVTVLAVALGVCVGRADARGVSVPDKVAAIAASMVAPSWAVTACNRSLSREHYDCGGCSRCQRRKYAGPLQFARSWNRNHAGCDHGYRDWRYCLDCSIARYMSVAVRGGKRAVRRQWGQTCGRL